MHLHISTLTQKGQATIPADIRHQLDLKAGDKIEFEVSKGQVILKKLQPFDYDYHRTVGSALSEWDSPEDNEAFNDL